MAIVSTAKLLLLLCAIAVILSNRSQHRLTSWPAAVTPIAILVALAAFAVSLVWTVAPSADALKSLGKYGKLLVIPVLMLLVRTRREALYALGAFTIGQLFLVLSSWLIFAHLPVPWATSNMSVKENAVFSSYLDQGIMAAIFAAICWHLRDLAPGKYGRHAAIAVAVIAVSNALFVLSGRSGHAVAITLLSIAIMWELPRRWRPVVVLLPFLLGTALFFTSEKVHDRLTMARSEVQSFISQQQSLSSSGLRLVFWIKAVQMIAERPAAGSGIGSWSTEYNRLQRNQNPAHIDVQGNGNPHQEYLQWGVQLGVPGILLFLGLLLAMVRDTLHFERQSARAAQSALAGLFVACLFNSSLYDALIGDFFCVTLGLLLALGAHPASPSRPTKKLLPSVAAA